MCIRDSSDVSEDGFFTSPSDLGQTVLPLEIDLHDLSILEVSEKRATLKVEFKVTNPNFKSVMLQLIKYSIYHDDELIEVGEIGTRPEGGITSPTYFIILNERPSIIGEKFTIKNTGNTPELWQALNNDELKWRSNDIFQWMSEGKLDIRIGLSLPLQQAAQAQDALGSRKTTGKVILIP